MDAKQVIRILCFFRDIEKEIKLCRRIIDNFESENYDTLGGVNLQEERVSSGSISDPTSRIALGVPESVSQTCRQMEERIASVTKLKKEVFAELEKLPYIQRAIIYEFYVERRNWYRIAQKEHYSITQCKEHRNKGVDNLAVVFGENQAISKFSYPN
jgi:hypothetical protein